MICLQEVLCYPVTRIRANYPEAIKMKYVILDLNSEVAV